MSEGIGKPAPTLEGKLRCLQSLLHQLGADVAGEAIQEARDAIAGATTAQGHPAPSVAGMSDALIAHVLNAIDNLRDCPVNEDWAMRWSDKAGRLLAAAPAAAPEGDGGALPDPDNLRKCQHLDCGRFDGPRMVECRARQHNACAAQPIHPQESEMTLQQVRADMAAKLIHLPFVEAWLAAIDAQLAQQAVDGTGRSAKDYAIEHASYLARAATHLITAINDHALAQQQFEEGDGSEDATDASDQILGDALSALRDSIYEFKKRRDRALGNAQADTTHG